MFLPLVACIPPAAPPEGRVVLLGFDGLEYAVLDRLGEDLPNFARLMREGARADMTVPPPIMSPILWTTLASGYAAADHGVTGWADGRGHPVTGADVRVERLWDAVSASGASSVVSGWLMTWPATPLNGAMVTDRFVWSFPMNKDPAEPSVRKSRDLAATTFPDALAATITALRPDEAWVAAHPLAYQVAAYGAPFHPLIRDETQVRAFASLWPTGDARLGALYLNGADQVSHLYWPFADPEVYGRIRADPMARTAAASVFAKPGRRPLPWADGLDAAALAEAPRWVPDEYRYLDSVLGRVRALLQPDTTLIVLSDHGFKASTAQPLLNGSHRDRAVFLAVGAHVKPGRVEAPISVYDVTPTAYALLGLPAAADMPGRVLDEIFEVAPVTPLTTRKLDRALVAAPAGGLADEQLKEQLQALGYLDEDGVPVEEDGRRRP